jgi:DNA-binding response OmpR family regulator
MTAREKQALFMPHFVPSANHDMGLSLWKLKPLFSKVHVDLENVQHGGSSREGARVMLVDDEHDVSMTFKFGLERKGFTVDVFNNPLQALAHFRPDYYDILLLDVRMPDMNGFELCAKIRKQDKKPKVLFVSAFEVHEDELKKYLPEDDLKCVVKKPILIRDLVKVINEVLSEESES